MQVRSLALGELRCVRLERSGHLRRGELLDLLRRATDEGLRIQQTVQLGQNGVEESGAADALEEVVVLAMLLDIVGGLVGKHTDLFVSVLPRQTLGNAGHDNVLGGHERKLVVHVALDDLGVHNKPGSDVVQDNKTGVSGQVKLRDADTADGTVVLFFKISTKLKQTLASHLPASARTIAPNKCPSRPWGGSAGDDRGSTDAPSASGYACKPADC